MSHTKGMEGSHGLGLGLGVGLIVGLCLGLLGCSGVSAGRDLPPGRDALVGHWQAHDAFLIVHSDGEVTLNWSGYGDCATTSPPCDSHIGRVTYGGGFLSFSIRSSPQPIHGTVTASTDFKIARPGSTLRLTLKSGILHLSPDIIGLAFHRVRHH